MVDIQSATAEIRRGKKKKELECGPMSHVMAALPNMTNVPNAVEILPKITTA